jgi:hypothetical protein
VVSYTTGTASATVTRYLPFYVATTTTFDRIGILTASAFSGTGAIRLGIYNNTNSAPNTVVLDAGTVATTAASTAYTITINQSLTQGWYWLAFNCTSAATTNSFTTTSAFYPSAVGNTIITNSTTNSGYTQTVNASSGFATAVSPTLTSSLFAIWLRAA